MKNNLFYILFFIYQFGFSQGVRDSSKLRDQKSEHTYFQFNLSVPISINPNAGEEDPITGEYEPLLLPSGITARIGVGIHHEQWIGVGMNTGIDWKGNLCLVVAPLFGSLRLSPQISENTRITAEAGYGRSFVIGRSGLVGNFRKISLGLESVEGYALYIELCQYGFSLDGIDKVGSFSVGISYLIF